MKQVRKHLTYANVMSSLAVFLILGGATAFAAVKKVGANEIKANSIKTGKIVKEAVSAGKIKNGAVVETKIGDGAVTTNKLADNAVTTPKIANDAVTGAKVNEGSLGVVPNASKLDGKEPSSYESKAFEAKTSLVDLPTNVETTLVTLNLPAGQYLIHARTDLNKNGAGNTISPSGDCTLAAGATSEKYEIPGLFGESGPGDRYGLYGQMVHTFAAAGQVVLSCQATWNSGNAVDPSITAISVQP